LDRKRIVNMKYTAALILASAAAVSADCSSTAYEEEGNWYCEAVSLIKYQGLDLTGSYQAVSAMDSDTGACTKDTTTNYSGPIAPFNEDVKLSS
jgi:hypothetical protein